MLAQLDGGASAPSRKRVGLRALERVPVREHTVLHDSAGQAVGEVSSGLLGPTINTPVAMAYVRSEFSVPGTRLDAQVRGKSVPMEVVTMPFVPTRYYRG